jgi:hypothetical protein
MRPPTTERNTISSKCILRQKIFLVKVYYCLACVGQTSLEETSPVAEIEQDSERPDEVIELYPFA